METVSLSFRTDSLEEYTSVIHLATSASKRRGSNGFSPRGGGSARSPSKSPDRSISAPLNKNALSPQAAYLPIGLSTSDPRWAQFSKANEVSAEFDELPAASSLTDFLNEMRAELGRVRALAQQKVEEADKRRCGLICVCCLFCYRTRVYWRRFCSFLTQRQIMQFRGGGGHGSFAGANF